MPATHPQHSRNIPQPKENMPLGGSSVTEIALSESSFFLSSMCRTWKIPKVPCEARIGMDMIRREAWKSNKGACMQLIVLGTIVHFMLHGKSVFMLCDRHVFKFTARPHLKLMNCQSLYEAVLNPNEPLFNQTNRNSTKACKFSKPLEPNVTCKAPKKHDNGASRLSGVLRPA